MSEIILCSPCVDCEKGPWYAGRGCGCQDFCKELEAYKGTERMFEGSKRNEQLESMIELTEGLFKEEGYKTIRYSETEHRTTAYDCLVLQDAKGNEFSITFDKSMGYNSKYSRWENTNIVGEKQGEK